MVLVFGYFATLIMGISLGLLGGGGSILTVPILVYLFKISPVQATAYSLFIVGLTAAFGSFKRYQKGQVHLKTALIFGLPAFLGVFLSRAWIVPSLPENLFVLGSRMITKDFLILFVFAVLMIFASVSMLRGPEKNTRKKETFRDGFESRIGVIAAEGLIVGAITGFVGAGGGFLIIPALVLLTGMPMQLAVGTSLSIIAFKSLFGFIGDVISPLAINWGFLLTLSLISIMGIGIGSYLSQFVSDQKLKKGFGIFILIMGSFILIKPFI